ncbi:T-cell surface glycoprotein CD8 beta chain [Brienomyrus brachyistius]|uniref:T-cell surface glycoprotein CD8 beta chain n=1 Tax=Brienomyrus brachyistius TaxID=42636 RepID=UPI0020B1C814|nr:T-cell surface glycoprotein CD8 beta chain [Brienomyrus brachyistius]XP_048859506.1 T-cell surface glycoprotein CD8 beta chain [Brienomyrus brachyistius]
MARLVQVWKVSVWTAVTFHVLHALEVQYPALDTFHTVSCECNQEKCQAVLWFRKRHDRSQTEMEFLLYYNNANRTEYAERKLKDSFKGDQKGSWRITYNLKIMSVKKEDAGLYFCLLQGSNSLGLGNNGVELRPGETPPTSAPPVATMPKKPCQCRNLKQPEQKECSRKVLWPLVGVLLSLSVVLFSTLYYFSRLPKKCRHRFAKKQQLM